jgi:hypothetical protein
VVHITFTRRIISVPLSSRTLLSRELINEALAEVEISLARLKRAKLMTP